jgi:hypothetical protein
VPENPERRESFEALVERAEGVRLECSDLSVELSGHMLVEDTPDLIWTIWDAKLVYGYEDLGHQITLAEARFGTVDFDRLEATNIRLDEALDEYSQDYTPFCSMADGFGISDSLQDRLASYATGLVVVDRVSVVPEHRGRKSGLLLTTLVLVELGRQRVAVAMPAAFEVEPGNPRRAEADRRNARLWEAFGFVRFADNAYYLDTNLTTLGENLERFKSAMEAGPPIVLT